MLLFLCIIINCNLSLWVNVKLVDYSGFVFLFSAVAWFVYDDVAAAVVINII